jgi:hypothetical protein
LLEKGRRFLECTEVAQYYYVGRSLDPRRNAKAEEFEQFPMRLDDIESEVMVDFDRAFQENPTWVPMLGLNETFEQSHRETEEHLAAWTKCRVNEPIDLDSHWDREYMEKLLNKQDILQKKIQQLHLGADELSDDDITFAS